MKTIIEGIENLSHIENKSALGIIIVDHESKTHVVVDDFGEIIEVGKDELSDICTTFRPKAKTGKPRWVKIKVNPLNPNQIDLFKGYTNARGKDINEGILARLEIA